MPFRPDYLKELREAKGWSQEELSKRSGVSQPVIAKSERGQNSPGSDALDRMAEALDCTIDYLVGRGPFYENAIRAASQMAFDIFVLRTPLTKQQQERSRRVLHHVDAPRTAEKWRSFVEMIELAIGQSGIESFDRAEVHPPKPQPVSVARRRHNYGRN
jgi:transcriptional regulator with XRE-family HTH domain